MMRWAQLAIVSGVVLGACRDDGNSGRLADAPMGAPDGPGAPDVAVSEGLPPPVTVTVTLGGVPQAGQTVYFQIAPSADAIAQLTGADGSTTALVDAGSYVTVIEPEPVPQVRAAIGNSSHLTTFADVQPGDHLYVDVPNPGAATSDVTLTVSVPNEQLGYAYTLSSTCGNAFIGVGNGELRRSSAAALAVTGAVTLRDCGYTADMVVVGTDQTPTVQSWAFRAAVPVVADGMVEFTSYAAPAQLTFSYPTVDPASSQGVNLTRELRTPAGRVYTTNTDAPFGDGTPPAVTVAMPDPPGALAITTSFDQPITANGQNGVIAWGANTDYSLDFSAVALHGYATLPVFDGSRAIRWTEAAGGAVPDFKLGSVTASRIVNDAFHRWTWRIVGAYSDGGATLQYPTLPTTLFDFNITADDSPTVDQLRTVKSPGGYDAARPRLFAGDLTSMAGVVAGATGQIVFEDMFTGTPSGRAPSAPGRAISRTLPRGGFTPHAR